MPDPAVRWRQVKEAFWAAEENGEAALDEICGSDVTLREEVLELLNASRSRPGFLEWPAAVVAAELLQAGSPEPEAMPEQLGPWRLLREVGRGGMSTVYLCERADGAFEKLAAVKILRTGALDEELRRRFARERQILARLDHPSIVRLIDGGVTPSGRPYLVTDFVDGDALTEHANRRELDFAARIALFRRVCEAVQYAHQHGVIHRDLKPSNIRVTKEGVPKLLDFGIAKLQHPERSGSDTTQTALPFLTWEYASPEQARGQPVDTRTDIYSLGVILCELIEDRPPYEVRGKSGYDAARIICESKPVLPARLGPVVSRMLEKDPEKRSASMTEVIASLAEPQRSAGSRLGKWVAILVAAGIGAAAFRYWSKPETPAVKVVPVANTRANEFSPSFSPDGRSVAFATENGAVFSLVVKDIQSGQQRVLLDQAKGSGFVRWSPDGSSIAFLHYGEDDKQWELSTIRPDGGGLKRHGLRTWWMDWAADGKSILYSEQPAANEPISVYEYRLEDGHKRRITFPRQSYWGDVQFAAAPDGQSIAVTRYISKGDGDIYVVWKDGSEVRLTQSHYWVNGLAYTPDSKEILAPTRINGIDAMWRIPIDRSAPRQIEELGLNACYPSLSRSRRRLAVVKRAWYGEVFAGKPGSGRLIAAGESAAISPDGTRVAFVDNHPGDYQIWIASVIGGEPKPLADPKILGAYAPRWAPDGRHLAFTVGGKGKRIYVADVSANRAWRLTTEAFDEDNATWSPDSKHVYFQSNRTGEPSVYRADVSGKGAPQLVIKRALEAIPGPDGAVYYLTQETAPLMVKPPAGMPRVISGFGPVRTRSWGVAGDGVYFVDFSVGKARSVLQHYRFSDGTVTRVGDLGVPAGDLTSLNAAQNMQSAAWSRGRVDADIVMIPEFR